MLTNNKKKEIYNKTIHATLMSSGSIPGNTFHTFRGVMNFFFQAEKKNLKLDIWKNPNCKSTMFSIVVFRDRNKKKLIKLLAFASETINIVLFVYKLLACLAIFRYYNPYRWKFKGISRDLFSPGSTVFRFQSQLETHFL